MFEAIRGFALVLLKEHEQALPWLQRAVRHGNVGYWAYPYLASCLGQLGRRREAEEAVRQLLRMKPDFSLASQAPLRNPEHYEIFVEGLRKAGLDIPDEPVAAD